MAEFKRLTGEDLCLAGFLHCTTFDDGKARDVWIKLTEIKQIQYGGNDPVHGEVTYVFPYKDCYYMVFATAKEILELMR